MTDLPVITKGTRVALTPQHRDNVPTYWKWVCDPEVNAGLTDMGASWASCGARLGGSLTTPDGKNGSRPSPKAPLVLKRNTRGGNDG